MAILTFTHSLNVSIQPGDIIYYCNIKNNQAGKNHPSNVGLNTEVKRFGTVTAVNHTDQKITCTKFNPGGPNITASHYVFFSKDRRVNLSGIVGYFAETEYRNESKLPAEMFATAANYVESSK